MIYGPKIYDTPIFNDVFQSESDFITDLRNSKINVPMTDESVTLTFYLLYARHGNDPIASADVNQFKYKVFAAMFQYGPTWEKRLKIQERVRGLSEEELLKGSKTVRNHAYNPSTEPNMAYTDTLPFIDDQTNAEYKRSIIEGYSNLMDLLETDVTDYYLSVFDKLFLKIVSPSYPIIYPEVEEEDEEE
jgi:hypothetical protein